MIRPILIFIFIAGSAQAETLVATRTIPARTVLSVGDLGPAETPTPGAMSDPAKAYGMEARITLYAGRPVRPTDIGPAALVDRNQIVELIYDQSGVKIRTDGRSLDRAATGERLRVMNLSSKTTVTGTAIGPGLVSVP